MATQSLANKYRPQDFSQVYGQGVVVDIVKRMCESATLSNRNFLFTGPAGTGKAQPLYSKVLTPDGFITLGEVKVGQKVITGSGAIAEVSGVYPQGVKQIYEITLQDRSKIRVAKDHLNVVYRYNQNKKRRQDYCMTTQELIEFNQRSRYPLRIDIPKIDSFDEIAPILPVDPYLLGVFLGDGSLAMSSSVKFSNSEPDIIDKVDHLLRRDWNTYLHKLPGDSVDYSIATVGYSDYKYIFTFDGVEYKGVPAMQNKLISLGYPYFDGETLVRICDGTATFMLKNYPELQGKITYDINSMFKHGGKCAKFRNALNLLGVREKSINKHIPKVYLLASHSDRLSLLQGLFDTDGTISSGGAITFSTSSKQLSEDFAFLVRSLGIRDTICTKLPKYTYNGEHRVGTTSYIHHLKIPNGLQFYTSAKHTARYKDRQQPPMRNIISIEYIGEEECQCIYVDHPDHTYISDGFIPTHNTTLSRIIAKSLNGNLNNVIEVDAASHSGVDDVRELIQQATQYPIGSKYKLIIMDECHSLSSQAWQALLKCLEEQVGSTVWIFCTTNPEKIPETIITRVQTFKLSKISTANIQKRLKFILDSEIKEGRSITYTDDALSYVARLSNGGMRDAITSLDKCLAFDTNITPELVERALDLPNYDDYFNLLNALVRKDNAEITTIVDTVYNSGTNFIKWFEGFHSFLCNIVKYVFLKDISRTMIPPHYAEKLSKYNEQHAFICLKLSNVIMTMNKDLKQTQYQLETAISYLCIPVAPKKEVKS